MKQIHLPFPRLSIFAPLFLAAMAFCGTAWAGGPETLGGGSTKYIVKVTNASKVKLVYLNGSVTYSCPGNPNDPNNMTRGGSADILPAENIISRGAFSYEYKLPNGCQLQNMLFTFKTDFANVPENNRFVIQNYPGRGAQDILCVFDNDRLRRMMKEAFVRTSCESL